jgi:ssDNA-binding Zn-finger/Zn-ribbon topoisomerase 1
MKKYMENCGDLKTIIMRELSEGEQNSNNNNENTNTIRRANIQACKCLKCGAPSNVVSNKSKLSYFLGCSTYPNCKWTQSLPPYISEVAETNKICPKC